MSFSRNLFVFIISVILINCRDSNIPTSNLDLTPISKDNIMITSPTSSENWIPGTVRTIEWNKESMTNGISIYLYRKDILILTIARNLENLSSYNWQVPTDLNYSHHYRIKIQSNSANSNESFSEYFYIIGNPEDQLD